MTEGDFWKGAVIGLLAWSLFFMFIVSARISMLEERSKDMGVGVTHLESVATSQQGAIAGLEDAMENRTVSFELSDAQLDAMTRLLEDRWRPYDSYCLVSRLGNVTVFSCKGAIP